MIGKREDRVIKKGKRRAKIKTLKGEKRTIRKRRKWDLRGFKEKERKRI